MIMGCAGPDRELTVQRAVMLLQVPGVIVGVKAPDSTLPRHCPKSSRHADYTQARTTRTRRDDEPYDKPNADGFATSIADLGSSTRISSLASGAGVASKDVVASVVLDGLRGRAVVRGIALR